MSVNESFRVGDWLIEPDLLSISKGKEVRKLEFKTMEILRCLVEHRDEVVTKKKLHDEVWAGVYVTDNALTRGISKLRKAFDDDPLDPHYIDTISKSGYRLVAPVSFSGEIEESNEQERAPVPTHILATNKGWIWGLLLIVVITGLSIIGSLSKDVYSGFYDPVPVSTLIGPERALAISPDGKKISFSYTEPGTNNSDVYVKLLDDLSQINFTALESQQGFGIWSTDGNYMIYASSEAGDCGIYKEPSFGGAKVRIGSCFLSPDDFISSPDGNTIAFTDVKSPEGSRKVYFLDIETQTSSEVIPVQDGTSDRDPVFTPNGEYLVYRRTKNGQQRDIYKMRLADKETTRLTFDNAQILGMDLFDDGEQIVFSSNRGGTWALWRVPFEGGEITRFRINDRVPTQPKFSFNGRRMVYKSLRDQTRIWSIEKESDSFQEPMEIASSTRAEIHPALSHDGKKMAFLSDRSGFFEVWIKDLESGNLTKLTSLVGSFSNMPTWSIDDEQVIFDARVDEDNAIYSIDLGSKMMKLLVELEGDQVNARYSSDGETLYFASKHSGDWQIWKQSVILGTQDLQQVTTSGGYFVHEGATDSLLYYTRMDTSGIWRINTAGKEELFIPNLNPVDWGNWIPTQEGIIYVDRSFGQQIFQQPYNIETAPIPLYAPTKRIQGGNPSLYANADGSQILFVQIEQSEDEIMMVDFK